MKWQTYIVVSTVLVGLLSRPPMASGEGLVSYGFEGEVLTPTTSHERITASDFSHAGGGVASFPAGNGSTDAYSKTGWPTDATLSDYYSFAITVDYGYLMSVTNLTFAEERSGDGPTRWLARYSLDDATYYALGAGPNSEGGFGATDVADASEPRYLTGTVYFRIYATNAASASGTWRVDDVTLNGTVTYDDGTRMVAVRDYDGSHQNDWGATTNLGTGSSMAVTADASQSGAYALKISGSTGTTHPSLAFNDVSLDGVSNAVVSIGFAALNVDADDDLWVDVLYDGSGSWAGAATNVQLADGSNQFDLSFGEVTPAARVPAGTNPYEFAVPASETQVAIRVRFQESSGDDTADFYYIDDVHVRGVVTLPTNAPVISTVGDAIVAGSSATIDGVLHGGYAYPEVRLYWGLVDGDTDTTAWSHEEILGTLPWQEVSRQITGLEAGTTYYYRWYAVNEHGEAWSAAATDFSTAQGVYASAGRLFMDSFGVDTVKPLCIDDDANNLSDRWEDTYLSGVSKDPDGDPDGDGVLTRWEQVAGTHPNDSDSYMRILSVDIADATSSNIAVQFIGGYHTGPTQYVAVGDSIRRSFSVLGADSAAQAKAYAGGMSGIMAGTNVWTDTNMVNESAQRYYGVGVSYAGSGYTNAEEWAVYVQERTNATDYKYLVSVPVDLGGGNNLNSTLGQQLARGLHAGSAQGNSDQLWYRLGNDTWQVFWLQDTGGDPSWREVDNSEADLAVTAGMGFWVVRNASGARSRDNAVFAGKSFANAPALAISTANATDGWHWNVFGWPFATPKKHENKGVGATDAYQLGFNSGYGGSTVDFDRPHEDKGDQIWIYEDNGFKDGFWLMGGIDANHNGRWWSDRTQSFADFQLETGKAYFYRHHVATNGGTTGVDFNWTPTP